MFLCQCERGWFSVSVSVGGSLSVSVWVFLCQCEYGCFSVGVSVGVSRSV